MPLPPGRGCAANNHTTVPEDMSDALAIEVRRIQAHKDTRNYVIENGSEPTIGQAIAGSIDDTLRQNHGKLTQEQKEAAIALTHKTLTPEQTLELLKNLYQSGETAKKAFSNWPK